MTRLEILPPAREDIISIAVKHNMLSGSNSARNITNKIRKCLELLKSNPFLGILCEEPPFTDEGYRRLICGKYLCFYKVIDVFVYRIVDGRTNYSRLFE